MACLEYITFVPWREAGTKQAPAWEIDPVSRNIEGLPQIFWANGEGWAEANHWALTKVTEDGVDIETAKSLMKHLHAYAAFLEQRGLDWRHFPLRRDDRSLIRFRGELLQQVKRGVLRSSTASARISAVSQFYRHAKAHGFISPDASLWGEKTVVRAFYDAVGFQRAMTRLSKDIAIPNKARPGVRLEDGLLPLSESHMTELLDFTSKEESEELHLMLTTGFFTGARFETIATMRVENVERAVPDPYMKGFFLIRVGPGSGVATKFDVEGDLLVPDFLVDALRKHAYSVARLKREAKANLDARSILFLTRTGRPYAGSSMRRLMTELRRRSLKNGLRFMAKFEFHETRATYGTWLMKLTLSVASTADAIEFVKTAMLHKSESTTFKYIKFLENSKGKQAVAEAFGRVFTGLKARNWNAFNA